MTVARDLDRLITEADLQAKVIDLARLRGWRIHAERAARTATGWRTPIQGHAGFPDLVLARRGRLLIAELKSQRGRLEGHQEEWLDELRSVAGVEVHVWRPSDWPDIERTLR